MNVNQMTEKAQEALLAAQELAGATGWISANRARAPADDARGAEGWRCPSGAPQAVG